MINGNERILYVLTSIDEVQNYYPIACLTSNTFSESLETLDTTTRISNGWKTSRPSSQSFNVDFEAVMVYNPQSKVSYNDLKNLKRNRNLVKFKIENIDGGNSEVFLGFITDLTETAVNDEVITFSGAIQGFGDPKTYSEGVPITFDSTIITFDNTNITFDNTI